MAIPKITGPGYFDIEVVGESYYQQHFIKFCGPHCKDGYNVKATVNLYLDDGNEFDSKAVAVLLDGNKVGFLPKATARDFRKAVIAGDLTEFAFFECQGHIKGGWDRGGGNKGHFGIWLDLPQDTD